MHPYLLCHELLLLGLVKLTEVVLDFLSKHGVHRRKNGFDFAPVGSNVHPS
jgi:hypothetical protein